MSNEDAMTELHDREGALLGYVDLSHIERGHAPKYISVGDLYFEAELDDYCCFANYRQVVVEPYDARATMLPGRPGGRP